MYLCVKHIHSSFVSSSQGHRNDLLTICTQNTTSDHMLEYSFAKNKNKNIKAVHLITLAQLSLSVALGNSVLQLAWNISGSSCCLSRYTELMTRNCRVYILDLPSGISEYCTHKTATICWVKLPAVLCVNGQEQQLVIVT